VWQRRKVTGELPSRHLQLQWAGNSDQGPAESGGPIDPVRQASPRQRGPLSWENWRKWENDHPTDFPTSEGALYSDAHITGELVDEDLPYRFLNTISEPKSDVTVAIVVRQWWSDDDAPPQMVATDAFTFHGGSTLEELASLVSCALGIRCRARGLTRSWRWTEDPLGRPFEFDQVAVGLPQAGRHGFMLPEISGASANLDELRPFLSHYRTMDGESARAVVRAARMYQQAIWIADDSPNLSWLYLVGAAEVAAQHWRGTVAEPIDVLRAAFPKIADLIAPHGDDLLGRVAKELAPLIKAQARFVGWLTEFMPPPPDTRPPVWGQVDWAELPTQLARIYTHRSNALHDGRPFPQPMCDPPRNPEDGPPLERPFGLASAYNDAVWNQEDTPMLLRTFEYLVRRALQAWWLTLGEPENPELPATAVP
jgi:hypothetical protein